MIQKNIDLSSHITLHAKVYAEMYAEAHSKEELIETVRYAISHSIPYFVLGGGSNLAPKNSVIKGLVIKNMYVNKEVKVSKDTFIHLLVSSGYPITMLVSDTVENGWSGFEYHKGLPGTLGGAIYMNSKWTHPWSYVSDTLDQALLLDSKGNEHLVQRDYFQFSYGFSRLQLTKEVLLYAIFKLKQSDTEELQQIANTAFQYRKKTQPFGVSTCGCLFKNISEDEQKKANIHTLSAGYLIDACGLKGFSIGDFEVSPIHANFIINHGHTNSDPCDLIQLVHFIKEKVQKRFNITLKEEVEYFP